MWSLILFLTACGDNSVGTGDSSSLVVETKKSLISIKKDELNIDFLLHNNYDKDITVTLGELVIDVDGCDVKQSTFSRENVVFNQDAEFVHAKVQFNQPCEPTAYQLKGVALLTLDQNSNRVEFDSSILEITPEEVNSTVIIIPGEDNNETGEENNETNPGEDNNNTENNDTSVDTVNYEILFSLEAERITLNLEEKKSFKVGLFNKDTNQAILEKKIANITISSGQSNLIKLFDGDKQSVPSAELIYEKKNVIDVYAQTNKHSGLADIRVSIDYLNNEGEKKNISKTYAVTILSGPPTAFSINDAGTSYNFETKWFENKFLISASDKYNNLVNISPTIYISAMTDFTRDSNGTEILYGKFGEYKGSLIANEESQTAQFEVNASLFSKIDENRDYLIIFGDVKTYEALGKWDIDQYSDNNTTLNLVESYGGKSHEGLGFAVGHNYMNELCSSDFREWELKIDSTDGNYKLDEEGKAYVTLKFPPYLYGKRVALSSNFLGKTPETGKTLKSGEVYFKTLNNVEGIVSPDTISLDANETRSVHIPFYINTGTGDLWQMKNAHVSCTVKQDNVVISSFSQNKILKDSSECEAHGYSEGAYWDMTISTGAEPGTVSFKDCYPAELPQF